ncbi:hypothetical protein TRFO_10441 [Tritrichomonas foetus]|uniref:Uncharacterized protein n=1 Tax=Tritrichomonas foetus TaxID=1144522 RepID=A0A1J4JBD7_9EUKA|nr:hypothetical protein TRFO_10441 [Tritrichomonas foetus]|eukprot:OHS95551.1 hypothetical protein TRFO_10441 [Tritrichomonas foetus]
MFLLLPFHTCKSFAEKYIFGEAIRISKYIPFTSKYDKNGHTFTQSGFPDEDQSVNDDLDFIIPGGYNASDCECYPCLSQETPTVPLMPYGSTNDDRKPFSTSYQRLKNKVKWQEKRIQELIEEKKAIEDLLEYL